MAPFKREVHPAEESLLEFFHAGHLSDNLRVVSEPFQELAIHIINSVPPGAETTTALRKLLEAKDCAVRAAL